MRILFTNLSPKQIVLKNTFWFYLGNFFSKVSKLLIVIISAKYLSPENYGHFSYILAIVSSFFIFNDWGSSSLTIRDYQKEENKINLINNFISFRLLLLGIFSLLIFLDFLLFKDYQSRLMFLIIFIFLIIYQLKNILNTFFGAIKKIEYDSISLLIESFLILISVFILLRNFTQPIFLAISYFIGIAISFLYSLFIFKKNFKLDLFKFNLSKIKYFLINGMPLMFLGILGFIFFTADQIILGYLKDYREVGYYSLVTKLIINLNLIISFFLTALFPYLSEISNDFLRVKKILNKVVIYNFLIYSIICFLGIILIDPIFNLVFHNKDYLPSITLFKFLIFITLLLSLISIFDYLLFIYNKQWQNFFITSICAILNLILNFVLIPNYGMYGAAISTYFSQVLNLILSFYLVKKYILNRI